MQEEGDQGREKSDREGGRAKAGREGGRAKMEREGGREGRHLFLQGALKLKFPHSLLRLEETFPHLRPRPGL